jgi:predicted nucleotidyltransferase
MIRNLEEFTVTRNRVAKFERLLGALRQTARPEEWPALSSGYRLEIGRMQGETGLPPPRSEEYAMNHWLQQHRTDILSLAAQHGARNVRVFGSIARDEAEENSDVDLLIEMEEGRSLLDIAILKVDLEERLHRSFDIVTEPALHWFIRDRVLREAESL